LSQNLSHIYRESHAAWCCVELLHISLRNIVLPELFCLLALRVLSDFDKILVSFWPFEHLFLD
jgi:hypothetical protein